LRLLSVTPIAGSVARALSAVGDLYAALAQLEPARGRRDHALAACEEALAIVDPVQMQGLFSHLHLRAAELVAPDAQSADLEKLDKALSHYRSALAVMKGKSARIAKFHRQFADALVGAGRRRLDAELLQEAVDAYRTALSMLSPQATPEPWVLCHIGLAEAAREIARIRSDPAPLDEAIAKLAELEGRLKKGGPMRFVPVVQRAVSESRKFRQKLASIARSVDAEPAVKIARLLQQG
jgi:tetratricopeptide (TPR) repeat protein